MGELTPVRATLPRPETRHLPAGDPSWEETVSMAQVFVKSGYFRDAKDVAQAVTKILYGRELGIPPVTALMSIYVVEGKPAPSANLLAAMVKRSDRYDYRVRRADHEAAAIEFFERGQAVGTSTFTMKEAAAAKLTTKDNWTKYPKAMLFTRAMTQGVRWFAPDLFGGAPVYSPEELGREIDPDTGELLEAPTTPPNLPPAAQALGEPETPPLEGRGAAAAEAFAAAVAAPSPAMVDLPTARQWQAPHSAIRNPQSAIAPIPDYPEPPAGVPTCQGEGCGRPLTKGMWTLSHRSHGKPLCPACQKQTASLADLAAAQEQARGMADLDPGEAGGIEEDPTEVPAAFR